MASVSLLLFPMLLFCAGIVSQLVTEPRYAIVASRLQQVGISWPVTENATNEQSVPNLTLKLHKLGYDFVTAMEEATDENNTVLFKVWPAFKNESSPLADNTDLHSFSRDFVIKMSAAMGQTLSFKAASDIVSLQRRLNQIRATFELGDGQQSFVYTDLGQVCQELALHVQLLSKKSFQSDSRVVVTNMEYFVDAYKVWSRKPASTKYNYLGWRLAQRFLAEVPVDEEDTTNSSSTIVWVCCILAAVSFVICCIVGCCCFRQCKRRRSRGRARRPLPAAAAAAQEPEIYDDPAEQSQAYERSLSWNYLERQHSGSMLHHERKPSSHDQQMSDAQEQCTAQLQVEPGEGEEQPAPALPPRDVARPKVPALHLPPRLVSVAGRGDRDSNNATIGTHWVWVAAPTYVSFNMETDGVVLETEV